jgi:lipoprotein-anchoring transpeptidase ErfK/SrfK
MSNRKSIKGSGLVLLAMVVAMVLGGGAHGIAAPSSPSNEQRIDAGQQDWTPPSAVYVAETGQIVQGAFLDYWRAWQGAASFGWPLTPEIEENGQIVQYFGYARLELMPDGTVRHGDLGVDYKPYVVEAMETWANEADDLPTPRLAEIEAVTIDEALTEEARGFLRAMDPVDPADVDLATEERRYVEETGHTVQFGFLNYWINTGEDDYLGNPITEPYTIGDATYQIFESGQLRWEPQAAVRAEPVGLKLAQLRGLDMSPVPQGEVPTYSEDLFSPPLTPIPVPTEPAQTELGAAQAGERWIQVDLTNQYMIAWEGDVPVIESYVSTGRDQFATPPGTFYILRKVLIEDMEGVIGGEYYHVADVPHALYFTDRGHAFHGTYWHNNFGTPMSHGCINLPLDVAERLYHWVPMGARAEIHY